MPVIFDAASYFTKRQCNSRFIRRGHSEDFAAGTVPAEALFGVITGENISIAADRVIGIISAGQNLTIDAHTVIGKFEAGNNIEIDARVLTGSIQAGQNIAIAAETLRGSIAASSVSINAGTLEGVIQGDNIRVSTSTFEGLIVTQQMADSILSDLRLFSTQLRPIAIVQALPDLSNEAIAQNYPVGSQVFLDILESNGGQRIYRRNATTGWVKKLPGEDIEGIIGGANVTINADRLNGIIGGANVTINADRLTGQINADRVSHINLSQFSGTLSAQQAANIDISSFGGTLSVSQVASISVSNLSGTLSAAQAASISINSFQGAINSNKITEINATTVVLAGTWGDEDIGSISAGKVKTGTLYVGGTNLSDVGTISVRKNVGGSVEEIAHIGDNGGTLGGWFLTLKVGGTKVNPLFYSDGSNLTIKNADIMLTKNNDYLQIAMATYDDQGASYSNALGVKVARNNGSEPYCWHVNRGLIIHQTTVSQLAAIYAKERNDGGIMRYSGEVILYGENGNSFPNYQIWMEGRTGNIHAKGTVAADLYLKAGSTYIRSNGGVLQTSPDTFTWTNVDGGSISSAVATTLTPGSNATANVSGSVLYLGIPQGIQGPQGPQGPAGADGSGIYYGAGPDGNLLCYFDTGVNRWILYINGVPYGRGNGMWVSGI